jgi:MFS family permease
VRSGATGLAAAVLDSGTSAGTAYDAATVAAVQRRTLGLLFGMQVISGVGVSIGGSVGALLAADMAGVGVSGLAQSAVVIGAALSAIPATAIVQRHGRRPSLAAAYVVATAGAAIIVTAAMLGSVPLLFAGFFLLGGATAAGLQARYAAVDLSPPGRRGRDLSLIVWATTIGAVTGPNLAAVAGTAVAPWGVPPLAGPFVFSGMLFVVAALVLLVGLRPDPIIVARAWASAAAAPAKPDAAALRDVRGPGMRAALSAVLSDPAARLGLAAVAIGHVVMIAVMAMTPVHIRGAGHEAAHTLRLVGIVLSLHIAGMFAFAPVMGWLTDRFGRASVIGFGIALLLAACALAGTAGHDTTRLGFALLVLGLGWSATMVAGSTLLTDRIGAELRAAAQGLSDLVMGVAGASAAALSGVAIHFWGYPGLAAAAAAAAVPLIVSLLRYRARMRSTSAA